MKKYQLILFDLDGTLADTSDGILECHCFANAAMGRMIDNKSLDGIIGGPLLKTYIERFGYSEEEAAKAVKIYRDHYAEVGVTKSILYQGMEECLATLKERGYLMAVATLKAEEFAKRILGRLGVASYFARIHGVDIRDTLSKKELLNICMNELSIAPEKTILVGDSEHDSNGAKQAGIDFLGVTYGFGFQKGNDCRDIGAVAVVDSCMELRDWFLSTK